MSPQDRLAESSKSCCVSRRIRQNRDMHDSFCPECKAKLKQKRMQWRSLWNPFPVFRCPSCATLLGWNKWTYAGSVLILWGVLLSPILLMGVMPHQPQNSKLRDVLSEILRFGVIMSFATPAALYCLLPLDAKKIRDN